MLATRYLTVRTTTRGAWGRYFSTLPPAVSAAAPSAKFLKRATFESPADGKWYPGSASSDVVATVTEMLANMEAGREDAAMEYMVKLDNWPRGKTPLVTPEMVEEQTSCLPDQVKEDIQYQYKQITTFAQHQMDSLHSFEVELSPGLIAGQRVIPVSTAGCYVPGGRYSHVSSATMSCATARIAGVENVVACSPPMRGTSKIHPATLYAMQLAGCNHILAMGGVQGIAAMNYGLFTGAGRADVLVGPGNHFVAEAKRILFGSVGIDMFAGPTEIMVLADHTADPYIVASDLVSQAEHGVNSPAWLITTDEQLGLQVAVMVDEACAKLVSDHPDNVCGISWSDYGEIVVVKNREEMAALSDLYAAEHLEVHADPEELQWWLKTLKNYGSLFLGEETTVTYGDKCSGTNHILPTKSVGRYSGGCSVDKFVKKLTYQQMDRAANKEVGVRAARISRLEGMEGHARAADDRLAKYFPKEEFDLTSKWQK